MNPPAASATPPITSKPTHSPQALASPRLVVAPKPNRKRAAATESARPTPSHSTSLNFRTLSIRVLFLELDSPRNDPIHRTHNGQDTAEGVGHGSHRHGCLLGQWVRRNGVAIGQEG